jgi:hypothetical protein
MKVYDRWRRAAHAAAIVAGSAVCAARQRGRSDRDGTDIIVVIVVDHLLLSMEHHGFRSDCTYRHRSPTAASASCLAEGADNRPALDACGDTCDGCLTFFIFNVLVNRNVVREGRHGACLLCGQAAAAWRVAALCRFLSRLFGCVPCDKEKETGQENSLNQ